MKRAQALSIHEVVYNAAVKHAAQKLNASARTAANHSGGWLKRSGLNLTKVGRSCGAQVIGGFITGRLSPT